MGRDALPPRDPSNIVFESSQQRRSFVIDPVASKAAGSSEHDLFVIQESFKLTGYILSGNLICNMLLGVPTACD